MTDDNQCYRFNMEQAHIKECGPASHQYDTLLYPPEIMKVM